MVPTRAKREKTVMEVPMAAFSPVDRPFTLANSRPGLPMEKIGEMVVGSCVWDVDVDVNGSRVVVRPAVASILVEGRLGASACDDAVAAKEVEVAVGLEADDTSCVSELEVASGTSDVAEPEVAAGKVEAAAGNVVLVAAVSVDMELGLRVVKDGTNAGE